MKKIVLASASPRRIKMFKDNGIAPLIIPADIEETLPFPMSPAATVMFLSLKKASHILSTKKTDIKNYDLIIAADTVVVKDNHIMGKPKDPQEAFDTLKGLSDSNHQVLTGVCIADLKTNTKACFCDETSVFFKKISDEDLAAYVNTSEPYDKAGGYAIQGTFGKYVDHFEGDLNNVIGLPWYRIKDFI